MSILPSVLPRTKAFAKKSGVDLAIPRCQGSGVGNALIYTRLVEDWARFQGRPISIVTAPLAPSVGTVEEEDPFTLWLHNPFVERIVDGLQIDSSEYELVDLERRTLVQVNHIVENISFAYGLRPRSLRSSLYLSKEEMDWGQAALKCLKRPLVCIHPGGTSRSLDNTAWAGKAWHEIIDELKDEVGFFQVGRTEFGDLDLGLINPAKTLRQTMAIIWAADVFVGFDSAPMHIATAFERKVITIYDMQRKYDCEGKSGNTHIPSVLLRWSYPFNRNIALMENDSHGVAQKMVVDEIRKEISMLTYHI